MDFTFTEEQETIAKVARQLFELVRRPVAKVQGPSTPRLERIAAVSDLAHMNFGAALDHMGHRAGLKFP